MEGPRPSGGGPHGAEHLAAGLMGNPGPRFWVVPVTQSEATNKERRKRSKRLWRANP